MNNSKKSSKLPIQDHIKLFIPGPSEVRSEILQAQSQWMIGHRMPESFELYARIQSNLQKLFFTEQPVLISTSSGTGLQEAAVRNCTNKKVLNCVNGAFSERWRRVTEANGKENSVLEIQWGKPVLPVLVMEQLATGNFDALTLVHNETSTGVISPLKEIAEAVRSLPDGDQILILVDSVSGLGGAELRFDAWDLDLVLTSSQKAMALPPGLAFCAVSKRAFEKARHVANRGYYFDLLELEKYHQRNQTPATPAISLLYALEIQLEHMLKEGLERRFSRHLGMRDRVLDWAGTEHFTPFSDAAYASPTVSCLNNDLGLDIEHLNNFLRGKGYIISNGYGPLKDKTFRIAHMGDVGEDSLEDLLLTISDYL